MDNLWILPSLFSFFDFLYLLPKLTELNRDEASCINSLCWIYLREIFLINLQTKHPEWYDEASSILGIQPHDLGSVGLAWLRIKKWGRGIIEWREYEKRPSAHYRVIQTGLLPSLPLFHKKFSFLLELHQIPISWLSPTYLRLLTALLLVMSSLT